jgi:CubicO group peptidase (beta-lactamase class C family)
MEAGRMPGMVVAWARGDDEPELLALGTDADGRALAEDTLFPVASISKLATALAALRVLELDDSVRRLLSHTSGLPIDIAPELAPYRPGLDWPALRAACLATEPVREPGTYVQYSNTGYGVLAAMVERATGLDFPHALRQLVLEPLGIEAYLGDEPPRPPARLADVRGSSAGTEREPYNSAFWRSLAAPWGGLLTDARGALALVHAFRKLPEATTNQTGDLPGGMAGPLLWERCPWGLGPELKGAKVPHWSPPSAGPDSYGHAGASGAFAWSDPSRDVAWAILGARTADSGWLLRQGAAIGESILLLG